MAGLEVIEETEPVGLGYGSPQRSSGAEPGGNLGRSPQKLATYFEKKLSQTSSHVTIALGLKRAHKAFYTVSQKNKTPNFCP